MIVVIAILAAITIVSYNGIQQRARNTATISTVRQVNNLVLLYETQMGKLPYEDSATLCATLDKKCTTYDTTSIDGTDNSLLMTELAKVGSVPPTQPPSNGPGRGVVYNAWNDPIRTNGGHSPLHFIYWLEGNNQNCVMSRVMSKSNEGSQTYCEIEVGSS